MDCDDCPTRREFLQLAGIGLVLLPIMFGEGQAQGSEHRYPFPAMDGVTIDRKEQVIVVRSQGHVYTFTLSCPHENTALKWLPVWGPTFRSLDPSAARVKVRIANVLDHIESLQRR